MMKLKAKLISLLESWISFLKKNLSDESQPDELIHEVATETTGTIRVGETLYRNLIDRLSELTDETLVSSYIEGLSSDERVEGFESLIESIERELESLETKFGSGVFYLNSEVLETLIEKLLTDFGDFPYSRTNEIRLITVLLIFFFEAEVEDDFTSETTIDHFKLIPVDRPIKTDFFLHIDSTFINSFVLFSTDDLNKFKSFYRNNLPPKLIYSLLLLVGTDTPINQQKYILANSTLNKSTAISFACFQIIKDGGSYHEIYKYAVPINLSSNNTSVPSHNYQQFNDTLLILSEYNLEQDILNKYLRLYQVIENFMVKKPIVGLQREHGGSMFSIREFKDLFKNISFNEFPILKQFFTEVLEMDSGEIPSTKLKEYVKEKWEDLTISYGVNPAHLDTFLQKVVKQKKWVHTQFNNENQVHILISRLTYSFRNSIVHNQETEFHLTHKELLDHHLIEDTILKILEHFMIPCIERIIFQLLESQNNFVWYTDQELKLYSN